MAISLAVLLYSRDIENFINTFCAICCITHGPIIAGHFIQKLRSDEDEEPEQYFQRDHERNYELHPLEEDYEDNIKDTLQSFAEWFVILFYASILAYFLGKIRHYL